MHLALSDIDRERFGPVTAKATAADVADIDRIHARCAELKVEFLILRIESDKLEVVQEAQRRGAFLTDVLLYFEKPVRNDVTLTLPGALKLRQATAEDAQGVARLATEVFKNYNGHYHADPRLSRSQADEVYSSWAGATCVNSNVADAVLILEGASGILGFSALKTIGEQTFDISLLGVSPQARRQGLFDCLLKASERWGHDQGFKSMEYSTQVTNVAAQRGLSKAGFLVARSCYTLHQWFN
jgi:ribosomal protein S18 acetylase RimI-like enzyme